jgi:hypothetical protein
MPEPIEEGDTNSLSKIQFGAAPSIATFPMGFALTGPPTGIGERGASGPANAKVKTTRRGSSFTNGDIISNATLPNLNKIALI